MLLGHQGELSEAVGGPFGGLTCLPPPPKGYWIPPTQRHMSSKRSAKEGQCKWVCGIRTDGGGGVHAGIISPGKISEGENSATLATLKTYTASHTHCTPKAPRFRQENFATFFKDEIIPRNYPPPL